MRMLITALLLSFGAAVFAGPALPGDSVYQVGGTWQTDNNESLQLASLAGKPQVIALIFTGCSNSCPIIVESMKRVENQIPVKMRGQIGFVLVSLTPDTDSPKSLKAFAEKKGLNPNWKLLRGNSELVRSLSNSLNGRYKLVKDGDIAHSNTVTLLSDQGEILIQANGTLTGIKPILQFVEKNYSNTHQ